MQISEKWLRTLVDPDLSTQELVHLLTMSGLEVEECHALAPAFSGVVVGRVLETGKHPNADRLSLCRIDAGLADPLSIVCGAPNVAVGMKVPVALIGAKLPGETADKPFEIKLAKMRGVESQGMLCSARELGLSQDHSGLMSLPEDAPIGKDFRDYYALDDALITIKLTPNRADCLSVLGVAREVSALTGAPLTPPEIKPVVPVGDAHFPFKISDGKACGRFSGRVITNVNAKAPTPDWMRQRLERSGQRSISALVDVTNYVMLELGRPLHVYNLDKLSVCIDVRFGRKGERLVLLNEQTVELDETVLCITDASGPIGLAGIMGGESTKADLETVNIFLESAFFFPDAIAGRTRRFNFTSDAAHRFERGVDFENNVSGLERATRLILDICGGEPAPVHDQIATLPERSAVVPSRGSAAEPVLGETARGSRAASAVCTSRMRASGALRRQSSVSGALAHPSSRANSSPAALPSSTVRSGVVQPALCMMPRWKSPAARSGLASCRQTLAAPADSPATVTTPGTPPKAAMFCCTQRRAKR